MRSAKSFWGKETTLFKRLFKKYPNEKFWTSLSLGGSISKTGRIDSLAFFFDKKNKYWANFLKKQWARYNWKPYPFKAFRFKPDNSSPASYEIKSKNNIRNFFKK